MKLSNEEVKQAKKQREQRQMTFSSKRQKEKQKRKRKIAIIIASIAMCMGLIVTAINIFVNQQSMGQKQTQASKTANDSAVNEILKNKKAIKVKDSDKKANEAAKKAIDRANAARLKKYIDSGKLITNTKNKQMIEDAVKKQADKDKQQQNELQDKLQDAQKQIKSLKDSQDSATKSKSDADNQVSDLKKQVSDLQNENQKLKQDLNNAQAQNKSQDNSTAKSQSDKK